MRSSYFSLIAFAIIFVFAIAYAPIAEAAPGTFDDKVSRSDDSYKSESKESDEHKESTSKEEDRSKSEWRDDSSKKSENKDVSKESSGSQIEWGKEVIRCVVVLKINSDEVLEKVFKFLKDGHQSVLSKLLVTLNLGGVAKEVFLHG